MEGQGAGGRGELRGDGTGSCSVRPGELLGRCSRRVPTVVIERATLITERHL